MLDLFDDLEELRADPDLAIITAARKIIQKVG